MSTRRIIGIDPGSRITGIGIIDTDGQRTQHVFADCLRLGNQALPTRLGQIFNDISDLIRLYQPDEVAIENVFVSNNAASALKLGQARGAAICAGVVSGLPVDEYSPKQIKQATVGKGAADKNQVQHMVKVLLNLQGKLQVDSADALAVALCHAHISHLNSRIAGANQLPAHTRNSSRR